jgi:hypothetical protein
VAVARPRSGINLIYCQATLKEASNKKRFSLWKYQKDEDVRPFSFFFRIYSFFSILQLKNIDDFIHEWFVHRKEKKNIQRLVPRLQL